MDTQEQETTEQRRIPATARLDPETFRFYQDWADREERTMSNVLHIALKRYRDAHSDTSNPIATS